MTQGQGIGRTVQGQYLGLASYREHLQVVVRVKLAVHQTIDLEVIYPMLHSDGCLDNDFGEGELEIGGGGGQEEGSPVDVSGEGGRECRVRVVGRV